MRTSYSKKHKAAISVLSGLTAALLLLTGCSKSEETVYQIPEDRKLIVYTAHKADVYEPIIKEFEERTGIFVELKAGDTLALFDELQQDAPGTFDVMFGGGVENFEECRDYLEPYKVSEIDQIAEQYRTEGDAYTPFSVLPTVFIYNNKLVYPVAAPRTWEEFQTDRWKGKIAFADPTKSGSSYTALCTMLQVSDQDEQKTLEDFTGALDGYLSPSSVAVLEEVNAGTRLVGITTEGMARQTPRTAPVPYRTLQRSSRAQSIWKMLNYFWNLPSVVMYRDWWRKSFSGELSAMIWKSMQHRSRQN